MSDMITDLLSIERKANEVAANYYDLVNDFRGQFAASIYHKNPALMSVRRKFSLIAEQASKKRLSSYEDDLKAAMNAIKTLALSVSLTDVERTAFEVKHGNRLTSYLKECADLTMMSIEGLSVRDIKAGCDQLKMIGFNIMTTMQNAGTSNAIKGAVVASVVGGKNYTGVNGKEWRSITASKTIARHHLLTVFNEATLFAGLEMGDTEFVIKSALSRNPLNNTVITLDDYNEIKAKVFHPNANVLIYRKISHQ